MERKKSKLPLKKSTPQSDSPPYPPSARVQELAFLLNASRKLSNILNPKELYSVLADLIGKELEINKLAIFIYDKKTEIFNLTYQLGTGNIRLEFKKETAEVLWQNISKNEPFAVCDKSGHMLYPDLFKTQGLDKLHSQLWAPLVMTGKVIGVVALGAKINDGEFSENDRFFIKEITAHAAVCINSSHLYLKRQEEKEELD